MGPYPKAGASNIWEAYAVRSALPVREVTDADVLAYMREQLTEKTAKAALLSVEIRMLTAGIKYLEGGGSIKDLPKSPAARLKARIDSGNAKPQNPIYAVNVRG